MNKAAQDRIIPSIRKYFATQPFQICRHDLTIRELLNQKVDLVEEGPLLPFAQETANNDKLLIYERNC